MTNFTHRAKLFIYILLSSIIYIVTAHIDGVKKSFHPQLNDLDNMLASAFHSQFKLSWLKESVQINVIAGIVIKLDNEKERLHPDENTHRIIEEEGKESSDFSFALHRKSSSKDVVGKTS